MSENNFSRPLNKKGLIEHFVSQTLNSRFNDKSISEINQAENLIEKFESESEENNTFYSESRRNKKFRDTSKRWELRVRIIKELMTMKRLPNDEKIKLGKGGALPNTELKDEKQAYIIIGLPASGKSGLSNEIADLTGSIIVDSDYAKRKFPEFISERDIGAYVVHKESSIVTFGMEPVKKINDFEPLIVQCCNNKYNIVLPRIGAVLLEIYDLATTLKDTWNYKVHLILVELDRKKATIRALKRFQNTRRYISLSRIFDHYSNEPQLTYYRLKNFCKKSFKSFSIIDTDVEKGKKYVINERTSKSPLIKIK